MGKEVYDFRTGGALNKNFGCYVIQKKYYLKAIISEIGMNNLIHNTL